MNRFDKPVQYDYSFDRYMPQFYVPNMELWAGVLDQKKKEEDLMAELTKKRPQHIETKEFTVMDENTGDWKTVRFGDTPMAQQYDQKIADLQKGIEEAALAGDKNLYNQRIKEAQRIIDIEWKPGGSAYWLQGRYDKLQKEKAKLAEQAAKDGEWGSSNMPFAEYKLYEESVGTYETPEQARPVGDVNVYPFVDLMGKTKAFAKEMGINTFSEDWLSVGPNGEYKIGEKIAGVTPKQKEELEAFMNQPQFRQQLSISTWGLAQGFTPQTLDQARTRANENLKVLAEREQKVLNYMTKQNDPKNQPTAKETEEVDAILYSMGLYGQPGSQDYKRGNTTNRQKALEEFANIYDPNKYQEYKDAGRFLREGVKRSIRGIAEATLPYTYEYNQDYDAMNLKLMDLDIGKKIEDYKYNKWNPKTSNPLTYSDTETITPEGLNQSYQSAANNLNQIKNTQAAEYKRFFGNAFNGSNFDELDAKVENATKASIGADGKIDYNKFHASLVSQGLDLTQNGSEIGPGNFMNLVQGANYSQLITRRKEAQKIHDNEYAVFNNATEQAYNAWVKSSDSGIKGKLKQAQSSQYATNDEEGNILSGDLGYLYGRGVDVNNSQAVFDYLFKRDYSLLDAEEIKIRDKIFMKIKNEGYWKEVKPIQQPKITYTPGKNTEAEANLVKVKEAFSNPKTIQQSKTFMSIFQGKHGKNVTGSDFKVIGMEKDSNGRWLAQISYKVNNVEQPSISAPIDEMSPNESELWRENINEDLFTKLGGQGVNDEEFMVVGHSNFGWLTGYAETRNRLNIEDASENFSTGHVGPVDFFTINIPESANGPAYKGEYRMDATKGVDGTTYSLKVLVGQDARNPNNWKDVENFTNFTNPDVLRASFANAIVANNPMSQERVVRRAKNVDRDYMFNGSHHYNVTRNR
jgi:hypothetical protein